jgi:protein TonB
VCHLSILSVFMSLSVSASSTNVALSGRQSVLTVACVAESSVQEAEVSEIDVKIDSQEVLDFKPRASFLVSMQPHTPIDPCPDEVARTKALPPTTRLTMAAAEPDPWSEVVMASAETLQRAAPAAPQPEVTSAPIVPALRRSTSRPPVVVSMAIPAMTGTVETTSVRLLENPAPEYPPDALRRGIHGRVTLRVTVSADGTVSGVDVARTSGYRVFDEAAAEAVRGWRFEPARRQGRAVPSTVLLPIRFLPR